MKNILSIDVEDITHSVFRRGIVSYHIPSVIDRALRELSAYGATATFFTVGEVAERFPEVIDMITDQGSEVAFHGYYHIPLWRMNEHELAKEIRAFKKMLPERLIGFRAPAFSLDNNTKWALKVLSSEGIKYDSSIVPAMTPLYGVPGAPLTYYTPSEGDVRSVGKSGIYEFPLLTCGLGRIRFPCHGGFFMRILPVHLIEKAIRAQSERGPAVIFIHTWELDGNVAKIPMDVYNTFITYFNLRSGARRLRYLLSKFKFVSFRDFMEGQGLL